MISVFILKHLVDLSSVTVPGKKEKNNVCMMRVVFFKTTTYKYVCVHMQDLTRSAIESALGKLIVPVVNNCVYKQCALQQMNFAY